MTSIAVRVLPARERVSSIVRTGAHGRLPTPVVIDVAIATLAVLLIASPLLFTSDGFAPDFTNNMWLAGCQEHAIAAYLQSLPPVKHAVAGPFGPSEKVPVFVMTVLPGEVYSSLPMPGASPTAAK